MRTDDLNDLAEKVRAQAESRQHEGEPGDRQARGAGPDPAQILQRATEILAPAMKERDAPAYPAAALGPLADACEAISTGGQVQPAMVGQCLLGAASLLTQGLRNVETLTGARPLSLYLLTMGDSGEGKSTAQTPALAPVHTWQREAGIQYQSELQQYERDRLNRKKGDDPPEMPRSPYRLVRDATVEGLRRDLDTGPSSQGIFTDEAAVILGGYGMSADHRSKTAGVFSGLWDSGHLSVSRSTGTRVERYGRRVAVHWLIQPAGAAEAIGDPLLSQLGFWPRFLLAWPSPQQPRKAIPFAASRFPAINAYWSRCRDLLALPLQDDADEAPVIPLTDAARSLVSRGFERFEVEARRGRWRPIRPFGLRAAEQACRVAGVLAAFAGDASVNEATMRNALGLVAYSLDAWMSVADQGASDPTAANALRLIRWLTTRPGWSALPRDILREGPAALRSSTRRDAAIDLLTEHELLTRRNGAVLVSGGLAQ